MNDIVIKIGELLVRAGIVTGVDLSEAEKLAKHMNLQFGQVLIMSGCLSDHDLDCALVAQQLIREELLTVDIACQALALASQHQMPFEDALEALSVVPKYGAASVEMAELLADAAIIPGEMLEEALMTSLTANVSLGELLVRENAISSSLIPVLNMMLADIGAGVLAEDQAINEIRKNHLSWQRSQDSLNNAQIAQAPAARSPEVGAAPVFVSQELMHAYEVYEPQQSQQQSHQQSHQQSYQQPHQQPHHTSQPASPPYAESPQPSQAPQAQESTSSSSSHSIHDVLSMFQQRNPVSENSSQAVPREQQAASWTAFVQSQSFDPNDVEPSVPPMSVAAEEPRLRPIEEPSRPLEVVQGTYAKTFDGKANDLLAETFEPIVPPDFEPAAEVIADYPFGAPTEEEDEEEEEEEEESQDDEQFSLLVELLIESTYFDREDIIEAITNALKEESKAVKLIEMLGLADARAIMAASICADALRKQELTSSEAVTVLGDIKGGSEIHEALESVNLELAVTVSANLQMMFDDEVDETFYVGDVSRTVDIFEVDDFAEEPKVNLKTEDLSPPPAVEPKDELPTIAFGYGRERLKIAKRAEPPAADDVPKQTPKEEPLQPALPVAAKAPDRPQTIIGGKKVSSLSEVFEKLSGVEGNGTPPTAPTPLSKPPTHAPAASTPVTKSTGSGSTAPTPSLRSSSHSPAASGPIVRPGAPPIVKPAITPPGALGAPVTPVTASSPAPTISPVADSSQAPTITPVADSTPAPTITPVSETPAPTITPVADATPAPTITPVADSIPAPTITPVVGTTPVASESPAASQSTSTSTDDEPLSEEEKKASRKRNSTTFNSLQAVFVPTADALVKTETADQGSPDQVPMVEAATSDAIEEAPKNTSAETFADVSNEASHEYAAYVSNKASDEALVQEAEKTEVEPVAQDKTANEHPADTTEEYSSDEGDEPIAASSRKKARSPKAKVRGGAKTAAKTGEAAPKKTKKRK